MCKARRPRIVQGPRLRRLFAEAKDAGAAHHNEIGARQIMNQIHDLLPVYRVDGLAIAKFGYRAAMRNEREAGVIEGGAARPGVGNVHVDADDVEKVATGIIRVVARPRNAAPRIGNRRSYVHTGTSA